MKQNIEELRKEAMKLIKKDLKCWVYRSCWNCNGAHEHLKRSKFVIFCIECGNCFFKGVKITEMRGINLYK